MENKYKVFITTSGIGERLGEITKYTNKSLVKLGKKPVISYIIDLYPEDTEFVVTIGYFADQIKDFLNLVYPERKFTFVQVDKYSGEGSSLGYSMLQAKNELQAPFIYHASDTVVTECPPKPELNWVGGYKGDGSSQYASFTIVDKKVEKIYDKGYLNPDYLHIGLIGVNEYDLFWQNLEVLYKKNSQDASFADIHVISAMLEKGSQFTVKRFTEWYDTGNVDSLLKARKKIVDVHNILDKLKESIYIFDNYTVKFFYDEKTVKQRVDRAEILDGLVPKIVGYKKNFYKYEYAEGDLYSEVANPSNFSDFLHWSQKNLWKSATEVTREDFKKICHDFYYYKSLDRINDFFTTHSITDTDNIINDEEVPSIENLFKKIDFDWLCDSDQTFFHGDFILDNIIKTKTGYSLLDWRQNFGGLLKAGDKYYDLAKLNHNLTVNHAIVSDNLFTIKIHGNKVTCDIMRRDNLVQCQNLLMNFIKKEGYDLKKVKLLTGLIWLNMAPLHHHPFDQFLFYFGKLNVWRTLNDN